MSPHLQELLRAFDDTLPLERARTIPSSWYFDAEVYELECRSIFGATWQVAARADQVAGRGDYATADLAGAPILVLRDEQGELRAFHNVCRHRAARVLHQPCGHATRLRCRYHGWTYDLAGRLRGTPEFEGVEDFARDKEGLAPLAVDAWGPLVFVHAGQPGPSLAEQLAPLPERMRDMGLETMRWVARREYEIACNWKVFIDNFQDGGYHVNTVHPALAGALDYAQYRTENLGQTSVQTSPLRGSDDPAVARVRTGDRAYYWWVFPNLMLNAYQGVMDIDWVLPLGPDRCRVIIDFYFADIDGSAAEQFIAESIAVAHQVQLEDVEICEEVQRGLRSGSFHAGRFSVKRESGGYHFHRLLAQKLRPS